MNVILIHVEMLYSVLTREVSTPVFVLRAGEVPTVIRVSTAISPQ